MLPILWLGCIELKSTYFKDLKENLKLFYWNVVRFQHFTFYTTIIYVIWVQYY